MNKILNHKLIICIVKKGYAKKMIKAAKEAGLEGATLLKGIGGASLNRIENFLGLTYSPEKDIIVSVVSVDILDIIIDVLTSTGKLKEKNTGILFVLELDLCKGIAHLIKENLS